MILLNITNYNINYLQGNGPYSFVINNRQANSERGFPTNFIRTTKYTLITFLPKNLFEQFRRVSNFYFLIVVIIQLVPSISPLNPITSILPLVFVLVITAIKEALEDFVRTLFYIFIYLSHFNYFSFHYSHNFTHYFFFNNRTDTEQIKKII